MKTSKKILTVVALTSILGTGPYAYDCTNRAGFNQGMNQNFNGPKSFSMNKGFHKRGQHGIMSVLYKLNLSKTQMQDIYKIKEEMMAKRVTPDVAFTKTGFDKNKFIDIMKKRRDNMIENKALMIEKVYKILTPKQKEQLKVLMELKKDRMLSMKRMPMMDKRMNF
jgi:periplasmic protein CpxP/Spy